MRYPIEVATMERSNFHTFTIDRQLYCLSERKIAQMFNKCHRTLSRRLRNEWTLFQALDLEPKPIKEKYSNKFTPRKKLAVKPVITNIFYRGKV